MNHTDSATWVVSKDRTSQLPSTTSLVMAWGRDAESGEARYIFDLDESRRGSKSGCLCYGCNQPLTAVNAAKSTWQKRPHFRHPDGSERKDCNILTARAALMAQLNENDQIVLPGRRLNATPIIGISGKAYDAWAVLPPQKVHIKSFVHHDKVSAILTLDDGKQVLVKLVGSLTQNSDGETIPMIQVLVNDDNVVSLEPAELKNKLHLLIESGTWCGQHWADEKLKIKAIQDAENQAESLLDWIPSEGISELGEDSSAESMLHWLTKEIILATPSIQVPPVLLKDFSRNSEIELKPNRLLNLSNVKLEKKVGGLRPDVLAQYLDPVDGTEGTLLIEVTVTNKITPERLNRIQSEGFAALEINIGSLGGTLTKQDFIQLVTVEISAKRWLHHPLLQAKSPKDNIKDLLKEYLVAVEEYAHHGTREFNTAEEKIAEELSLSRLESVANELSRNGYPHALNNHVYRQKGGIVTRLLSIKHNRVIGYRYDSVWQVINSIMMERSADSLIWHTVYLAALRKIYKETFMGLKKAHQEKIEEWREKVLHSLRAGEPTYHRSHEFDKLLGALFEELEDILKKPLPSKAKEPEPKAVTPPSEKKYLESRGGWLVGNSLEDWKRQNPESIDNIPPKIRLTS